MTLEKALKMLEYQRNYQRELRRKAREAKLAAGKDVVAIETQALIQNSTKVKNSMLTQEEKNAKILAQAVRAREYAKQYREKTKVELEQARKTRYEQELQTAVKTALETMKNVKP
jgi:hypothetical protein